MVAHALHYPHVQTPPPSLRRNIALVVSALSLVPNLVVLVMVLVFVPSVTFEGRLWLLLLWLLVVTAASGTIGLMTARVLFQPLTELRRDVAALSSSGARLASLALPEREHLPEEVAQLRHAFVHLLERLGSEQNKRNAFTATLVHDLKTPIIATSHILKIIHSQADLGREERLKLIEGLLEENQRLLAFVQKMVDAHRFERGEITLELEPTDLGPLLRNLAKGRVALVQLRGLKLRVEGSARALTARNELERAIGNLLDNALRYAKSSVVLEIGTFGSSFVTVTVTDDGPGLPAPLEELARPFASKQVELGGQRFTSGTGGLGLFIAREIIAAHGGRLEHVVDPNLAPDLRVGTCFRVLLPAARTAKA
jgi:signal transduction histidine kinase